jgi:hypothetical protein
MKDMKDETIRFLLLRLFFSTFWLLQAFGKMFDQESRTLYWENLAIWSRHTTEWFVKQTILPAWFVAPYTRVLPYCEIAIGLAILAGLETRRTLIASALLLISLDAGLLLQLKHGEVALNTIYLLAILKALSLQRFNRWTLDEFLGAK